VSCVAVDSGNIAVRLGAEYTKSRSTCCTLQSIQEILHGFCSLLKVVALCIQSNHYKTAISALINTCTRPTSPQLDLESMHRLRWETMWQALPAAAQVQTGAEKQLVMINQAVCA
jgi:hypothetical protein